MSPQKTWKKKHSTILAIQSIFPNAKCCLYSKTSTEYGSILIHRLLIDIRSIQKFRKQGIFKVYLNL